MALVLYLKGRSEAYEGHDPGGEAGSRPPGGQSNCWKETTLPKDGIHDNIETADDSFTIGVGVGAKAKNYDVMDLESGEIYHFVEGSKVQDVKVFAGKSSHTPLEELHFL